ncbi:MAG: NAD(P)-dependent oxidoreductase [Pseudomonadota bacterium]
MDADVGVIGVGQMGSGIVRQLAGARKLAAVFHTDADHVSALNLPAPIPAVSADDMARRSKFILFVVPSSVEIDSILTGDDALLDVMEPGTVLIDLTTSNPSETRRLASLTTGSGGAYLDCGMSGGALAADAGKLTLMMGGSPEAVTKAWPVLDVIAEHIFHLGPSGAGHTMKLIHNLVCHTIFLATCEGGRLAESAGISLERAVEVFNAGNARSFASEVRFPQHIVSGTFDGRSRIANLAKDLTMGVDLADQLELPISVSRAASEILGQAMEAGEGERDFTRLYADLDRLIAAKLAA